MYAPDLGRFLQTDPIGYGDGMNLYGYVGGDPVNASDPSGLCGETNNPCPLPPVTVGSEVVVTANRNSGGVNIIGTIVGAAKLVNKGLCAIGIKFFGGCKKKKAAPTAAPTAAPEPQRGDTKPLPPCMQAFLNRAHPGFDYSEVQLVNGLPPGFDVTDNNVTFGNTIYLDPDIFRDVGIRTGATTTVFHEFTHSRDYAEGRLSVGGYIVDALRYRSHDSIPSEIRANSFMNQAMSEFKNSAESKTCSR